MLQAAVSNTPEKAFLRRIFDRDDCAKNHEIGRIAERTVYAILPTILLRCSEMNRSDLHGVIHPQRRYV
jgi:hypothetical protein